ncbi:MAG: hypothetical protein UR60_C0015G0020 [Candidatus Moranbacteria bacterium GW2011_GWF2_34_56]|nr:MAG: hypothetical protein UR51_C0003G0010 [Candidatus Moranbacteria bacterium GW2011_GWF1_34_10]KKP64795.1 MAG: hypothetical protein UR60_C0015G0020 [Candidatus Moranbacteria bacterium GW2011_GWF2_34_56]HBI16861.1 hypothetical protein [Candidatus Moranbacteria bacterium]
MHKLVILITVVWFGFCGCTIIPNDANISLSYEKRKQILDKWIGSMDSDNAAVANIAEILRNVLYVAEPAPSHKDFDLGIRVLEEVGENKFIPVVVVLAGDEDIGLAWEEKIRSFWGLLFVADYPLAIIRDDKVSDFWRGIIMLYQGSHVASYLLGSFDSVEDSVSRIVVGEYCAYKLISDVLDQKGGQKYQKILDEKVSLIQSQFQENGIYLLPDFSEEERLNDVFAEAPLSTEEIHVRWKIFWIHAVFKSIESSDIDADKRSQEKTKINYLFALFGE